MKRENIWLCDIHGLVYEGREEDMNPQKAAFAQASDKRTLDEVIEARTCSSACRARRAEARSMVARMATARSSSRWPTPTRRSCPTAAREVAPDAIIATGRSDFPNQVNNVLCFPFIFRGALDVGATEINDAMQIACVEGIAALARATTSAEAAAGLQGRAADLRRRLPDPQALRPAAVGRRGRPPWPGGDGNRRRHAPAARISTPTRRLDASVFKSALLMRPVFEAAATASRRIVFAEGEDERVLRAAQAILEETTETPILIGRPRT